MMTKKELFKHYDITLAYDLNKLCNQDIYNV